MFLWLVQSHQNDYFDYDLFKVIKMTILIMTCSKLAKWLLCFLTCSKLAKWLIIMTCSKLAVLNKAIQGTFFKFQKSKKRLKRHINYGFLFTWEKQWQIEWFMALFKSQKSKKKRVYGNYRSIFACDSEKLIGLKAATLLKKRLWHRCFSVNFVKLLWTAFYIELFIGATAFGLSFVNPRKKSMKELV